MPTQSKSQHTPSKGQHTPGPWSIVKDRDGRHVMASDTVVCEMVESGLDARLIAQAPRMLEILREVLTADADDDMGSVVPKIRQILAEVEGS